jgi:hypothetical protein
VSPVGAAIGLLVAAATAISAGQPQVPGGLLIIAPEALSPALADFVAFKNRSLPTRLVDLEEALAAAPGADDPEKLKEFLYRRWRDPTPPRLAYVLLVGDADIMPVRYMVLDRNTEPAFNYAFYPSDLYYADLAKPDGSFEDWNGVKGDPTKPEEAFHARYFGEVRGEHFKSDPINYDRIDYRPEIGVGRWPVSTPISGL